MGHHKRLQVCTRFINYSYLLGYLSGFRCHAGEAGAKTLAISSWARVKGHSTNVKIGQSLLSEGSGGPPLAVVTTTALLFGSLYRVAAM